MPKRAPSISVEVRDERFINIRVTPGEGSPTVMEIDSDRSITGDIYSGTYRSQVGKAVDGGHYKMRARVGYGSTITSNAEWSAWSSYIDVWTTKPPTPSVTNVVLETGGYARVSLSYPSTIDRIVVQRDKQGSSYYREVYNGAATSSIRDSLPGAGTYKYRVKSTAGNLSSDWSSWSRTVTVVSVPSAPIITNVQRLSSTQTKVSLNINSSSATKMSIYRQKSGQTSETRVYYGSPTTAYTDTPGAGIFRYRAKNQNVSGESGYSSWSEYVSTIKPPNAPTLLEPSSSAVLKSTSPIKFKWRHNPADGSAQTEAELKVHGTKSPSQTIVINSSADNYTISGMPGNQDITFQVRTKGLHADFSPWSATRSFKYLAPISGAIKPIGTVKQFPIPVSWTYEDGYGTQANAQVRVYQHGDKLFERDYGSSHAIVIDKGAFSLKDAKTYTIYVNLRSTSGMTASIRTTFTTKLATPGKPTATITSDNESGSIHITPHATSGEVATESFTITRNGRVIAEGLSNNTSITDSTAPIDIPLEYEIKAISELGTSSSTAITTKLESGGFAFINFDEGFADMAKLAMDLRLSEKVEVDKTMMVTPSRKFPVVIYGDNESVRGSLSAKTWWLEDMSQDGKKAMCQQFEKLARYKGVCMLRLPHQETKFVIMEVGITKGEAYNLAGISINYQEVDSSGLD